MPEFAVLDAVGHQLENRSFDPGRRNISFETSLATASADAPRMADRHVPELAGETVVPVNQLAVGYEPAAESRAERHDQKVLHAARAAVYHFADGRRIGVVGNDHRQRREETLHFFDQIHRALPR